MYIFARVLRLRIPAALFSGIVFMFSGFLIVSVVFTMFIAAVVWLPLLLAVIEWIIRKQEEKGATSYSPIPYVVVGALIVGVMILAGHPELIYYTLLVAGAYSGVRLLAAWWVIGRSKNKDRISDDPANGDNFGPPISIFDLRSLFILRLAIWLLVMVFLGVALGAIQLIPLLELVPMNFREGSASLAQVRGWAWPSRHILTFPLPNIFGSPSHHGWFDIWTRQWNPATVNALGEPIDNIFWGIKNYVEGGNYLGVVTWVLAAIAVVERVASGVGRILSRRDISDSVTIHHSQFTIHNSQFSPRPVHTWFFASLAALSLLFAFGTPLYAILFYGLPGWDQLHSPFRWVFPFTVSMAVLGGVGLNVLLDASHKSEERRSKNGSSDGPVTNGAGKARGSLFDLRSLLFALLALAGLFARSRRDRQRRQPHPLHRLWPAGCRRQRSGADGLCRRTHVLELPGRQSAALRPDRPAQVASSCCGYARRTHCHPVTPSPCHPVPPRPPHPRPLAGPRALQSGGGCGVVAVG